MQDKYHDTITEADCATLHRDAPDKERYLHAHAFTHSEGFSEEKIESGLMGLKFTFFCKIVSSILSTFY